MSRFYFIFFYGVFCAIVDQTNPQSINEALISTRKKSKGKNSSIIQNSNNVKIYTKKSCHPNLKYIEILVLVKAK
jgi:hypothetical protein